MQIEGHQLQPNKIENEDYNFDYLQMGENGDSKNNTDVEGLDNENLQSRIQEELKKQEKEQQILLKENKQNVIDFIIDNKDAIKDEDLKIYEPIYKCCREKGNCYICNNSTNIICKNTNHSNIKEVWLCTNHWKQHAIEKHG